MKSIELFGLLLACVLVCNSSDAAGQRRRPDANSKPSGGMVEKPYSGNVFRFVDAQSAIPHEKIASFVQKMRWSTILPFEVRVLPTVKSVSEGCSVAETLVTQTRVGAGIVIVDDPTSTQCIDYKEANWAVLNLAFLKKDNPSLEKLEQRAIKILWIAAARVLGAGYSNHTISVLKPFRSLKELDRNPATQPSPDGFNAMLENAKAYGITTITISSYRTACRNGWAPAPTNAYQQAIWDEMKAEKERGPTNGLQIPPPNK